MACKIKKSWVDIELEHTSSRRKARKIVKDHLAEMGCDYYPELIKMEKKIKQRSKK